MGKQSRSNRRWPVVTLAIVTIQLLVACAPTARAPAPTPAPAVTAPAQKPAAAQPAVAPAAEGWQAEWDRTVAAAKQEKLVVVTQPSSLEKEVIADFQKAFPDIPVEHTGARPSDISPKVITEQQNGVFAWDVMQGPGNNMNNVLLPAGAYQDIQPFFLLPDVTDNSKWGGGGFEMYSSPKGRFIFNDFVQYSNTSAVFINRDKIPATDLKDFDDLLKPQFKGMFVADDCTVAAHGLSTLWGLYNSKGEDFVRRLLSEQKPVFQDTIRITTEWIATGRYPIAIGMDVPTLLEFQKNGVGGNVDRLKAYQANARGLAVFKNAPHPNAAKVYVNWALTREGQASWVQASQKWNPPGWNSRRLDVPPSDTENQIDWTKFSPTAEPVWGNDSGIPVSEKLIGMCKEAKG
jgi:iron(III) transport system substrate-binding protein